MPTVIARWTHCKCSYIENKSPLIEYLDFFFFFHYISHGGKKMVRETFWLANQTTWHANNIKFRRSVYVLLTLTHTLINYSMTLTDSLFHLNMIKITELATFSPRVAMVFLTRIEHTERYSNTKVSISDAKNKESNSNYQILAPWSMFLMKEWK